MLEGRTLCRFIFRSEQRYHFPYSWFDHCYCVHGRSLRKAQVIFLRVAGSENVIPSTAAGGIEAIGTLKMSNPLRNAQKVASYLLSSSFLRITRQKLSHIWQRGSTHAALPEARIDSLAIQIVPKVRNF